MILKRLFPQFSTYQSYVAIISNAFSIEVKLLTGDTEWQPQPRYLFERYIFFQNKNECGLKQGARERFNRRIFQWQWREIEIWWKTGAGKRRTRSGMVIEEEERGRWKRSIRRGWGGSSGWGSSGQKSQWASFSPLLQVDLSRCRSCHYFKAWYLFTCHLSPRKSLQIGPYAILEKIYFKNSSKIFVI